MGNDFDTKDTGRSFTGISPSGDAMAGKTSRTDRLGMSPYACEEPGPKQKECILEDGIRTRVAAELVGRTERVATNFQLACSAASVEQLLKKDTSLWGSLADVLFTCISAGLGKVLVGGVRALVKAYEVTKYDPSWGEGSSKQISGAVSFVFGLASGVAKTKIKNAAKSTNPDAEAKLQFLAALMDALPIWALDVRAGAHDLDDLALIALLESLDPGLHSVDRYRGLIDETLARFQSQILDVGKQDTEGSMMRPTTLERRIIRIHDEGFRARLASVDAIGNEHWRFREWIDDGFTAIADRLSQIPSQADLPMSSAWDNPADTMSTPEVSGYEVLNMDLEWLHAQGDDVVPTKDPDLDLPLYASIQ